MSPNTSTRQQRRQETRSTPRAPARAPSGPVAAVLKVITVDAPAWNATWAAVLVVPVVAWALGAWLLPALDIRPRTSLHFVDVTPAYLQPEPLEQQRYVLAVLAALAIVPCALLVARRPSLARVTRFAPPIGLVAILATGAVCLVRGYDVADRYYSMGPVLAIVVAAVLAFGVMTLFAGRCRWLVLAVDRLSRRRGVEALAFVLAIVLALGVVSVGIYTDRDIMTGAGQTFGHLGFTFEEATAVAYGRTPLVDFTPQYTVLFSWLLAPIFLLESPTIATFTATMAGLGVLSLACLYLTFRLVTGTAARALLLFLPVCAIGFVRVFRSPGWNVHTIANYFAAMPLRDAGPLVLALVCVVVVGGQRSRARAVALGASSAVAILLNVEFGAAAALATVLAALALNQDERPLVRRSVVLLGELAIGAVAVCAVFALMTLARSGSLPEPGQLVYFQRQFGAAGFFMLPMDHLLGFHTLVFATCAAAAIAGLGIAAFGQVRAGVHGRRSTALLIYSGVFGFGAFEYYMGRTHPDVLSATFLAWAIALMALCWEAGCRLAAGGTSARAVRPVAAVLLVGTVIASVIGVRHLDYVVHQPARIAANANVFPVYEQIDATYAARQCIPRGADSLILAVVPDRIAHAAHIHNWNPYDQPASVVTTEQIERVFSVARAHRVTAALTQRVPRAAMTENGFVLVRVFRSRIANPDFQPPGGTTSVWARRGVTGAVNCHRAGAAPNFVTG